MSTKAGRGLKDVVERALEIVSGKGLECDIYAEDIESLHIEVFSGSVESVDRSREAGIGIRVVSGDRPGYAWTHDLSDQGLASVVGEAEINSSCADASDADILADAAGRSEAAGETRKYPSSFEADLKIDGALAMEEAALSRDGRITSSEGASYSEATALVCVGGTRGFLRTRREGFCACSIGAAAASDGEVRSGWSHAQAQSPDMLDFRGVGIEAGDRAVGMLGGRPMPTGRYAALFDGLAFSEIVSLLGKVLSGKMVVQNASVLRGRLGQKVASEVFTLVDDPGLQGGCFNSAFDDEGVICTRRELVKAGVLEHYLYDSYSARKTGSGIAGNAFRESCMSTPLPGPSNLFVEPGAGETEELVKSIDSGIFIQDVMGMHTADQISGDFSIGVNGYEIRGGERKRAVCEMTISGNVLSLLDGVVLAGSGVRFAGRAGSPPVIVDGLSLSGR